MGDMTDAFMTAAVLMAVAQGESEITNIANQRVKESNRIAVMVEGQIFLQVSLTSHRKERKEVAVFSSWIELGKCGVETSELPDGIKIKGKDYQSLNGSSIACHDDHRIAMSFAVLGCLVKGIIITDKACVEKTYPEFWDHLERFMSVQVKVPKDYSVLSQTQQQDKSRKTLVIIGSNPSIHPPPFLPI